jgi:predicted enzyme related to lactoylglutathione lyase
MRIWGVDLIIFNVGDLNEAVRFYETTLGFPVQFRSNEVGVAIFRLGSEFPKLMVTQEAPLPSGVGAPRLWLEVSDTLAVAQELKEKGCRFVREPHHLPTGWLVEIADPWGNVIGFMDYVNEPEYGRAEKLINEKDSRP